MRHNRLGMRTAVAGAALALLVVGCGDDDDTAADSTTTTTATADEETTTTTAPTDEVDDELTELCALATEIDAQEDFPAPEQLERYRELAPEEIRDAVEVAAPALIESAGDLVATFAAFADDGVEDAIEEIEAFEEENCGIDNSEDDGAAVVAVTAVDYSFEFAEPIAAGRTSFVVTNTGQEAHFLVVTRIAEGHTLQEALAFEGDPEEAGLIEGEDGESGLAAPGGDDEEFLTMDLEPGNYGMLCFVPAADGTPHAFMGMAVPFTVS
jgi:hypothetical protein